jgi:hypothetical protein
MHRSKKACLFDHLVSASQHSGGNGQAKRLRGLEMLWVSGEKIATIGIC